MQATLAQAAVIALMLLLSEPASIAEESRCDPQRVGVSSMEAEPPSMSEAVDRVLAMAHAGFHVMLAPCAALAMAA